jgi:Na+-translocating ferredoxin:NAD+ oxidoreductase RnfC subunit
MDTKSLLVIKQEQAQAILNYLAKQPYEQVFQLVAVIQSMSKFDAVVSAIEDEKAKAVAAESI